MKKILFLLLSLPLSIGLLGQAKPPVPPQQVGTGVAADAGKLLLIDANGRGMLAAKDNLVWQVGGNTVSANGVLGTNGAYDLIFQTNAVERLRIAANGSITAQNQISVSQDYTYNASKAFGVGIIPSFNITGYNSGLGVYNDGNAIQTTFINNGRVSSSFISTADINKITVPRPNSTSNYGFYLMRNSATIAETGWATKQNAAIMASDNPSAINIGINGYAPINFYNDNGQSQSTPTLSLNSNRNVGIGTSTPSSKLHVVGTPRFEGLQTANATTDFMLTADATGVMRQRTVANLLSYIQQNMWINGDLLLSRLQTDDIQNRLGQTTISQANNETRFKTVTAAGGTQNLLKVDALRGATTTDSLVKWNATTGEVTMSEAPIRWSGSGAIPTLQAMGSTGGTGYVTLTVPGAKVGQVVTVSANLPISLNIGIINTQVSAADTVKISVMSTNTNAAGTYGGFSTTFIVKVE